MKKSVGYIVAGAGVLIYLLTFDPIKNALKIPLPAGVTDLVITVLSLILIIIGAVLAFKGKGGNVKEVPVYQGKEIVGFRRIKS